MRQMVAIAADDTRAGELARIAKPTLVLHGKPTRWCRSPVGRTPRGVFRGRGLPAIEGMGHDLAAGVVERLLPHMAPFLLAHR
jgi:hypothetical protein